MKTAYLDYQASTPLDPRARDAMLRAFSQPGNASAEDHAWGWAASAELERARAAVAALICSDADEVTFTSGATEANNIAILGAAATAPDHRRTIIVSAFEHKAVLEAAYAAEKYGFNVVEVEPSRAGVILPQALEDCIDENVAVVSIMAVNNEIGTVQPIAELAPIVRRSGGFFHVDATQAMSMFDVNVRSWDVDALSLSGHKMYGPQGIGALFISNEAPWRPAARTHGGGQEGGLRPGTVPVPLCVGLAEACGLVQQFREDDYEHALALRARLLAGLKQLFADVTVTAEASARHPGCLHVRFAGISASDLLLRVQPALAAATGSACTSGLLGSSHVALAIGMTPEEARECVRFSVGRFSTPDEIDFALMALEAASLHAA